MKITVFGGTGVLGIPVVRAFVSAGFDVTVAVRDAPRAEGMFSGVRIAKADLRNPDSLPDALSGAEAVYASLSVGPTERAVGWHAETDGVRALLAACAARGVRRFSMISSLVMNYQGTNGFHWWAFDVKKESVRIVRESGIPYTIFYPSSFMENFLARHKRGATLANLGRSEHPMWYIAGEDYGRMAVSALTRAGAASQEYPIQGPEPYTTDEALRIFARHYLRERLTVKTTPLAILKIAGVFSVQMNNAWHILEALNKYPEQFQSERTWEELGKPTTTIPQFAQNLNA